MITNLVEKDTKICYVGGDENPLGLHVSFTRDDENGCRAIYTVQPEHVGWPDFCMADCFRLWMKRLPGPSSTAGCAV